MAYKFICALLCAARLRRKARRAEKCAARIKIRHCVLRQEAIRVYYALNYASHCQGTDVLASLSQGEGATQKQNPSLRTRSGEHIGRAAKWRNIQKKEVKKWQPQQSST